MKDRINEDLWNVIENHYEKGFYTDAVKDACFFINEIIQNKSGLNEIDGEKLINTAFSEKDPKLLVNANQTQTEKDIQRGTGYLLRGITTAIRNPISHKIIKFEKEEADAILLFLSNYILPKIDSSKESVYIEDWFEYIFMDNNDYSDSYCDIVIKKISKKEKYDLMLNIVDRLSLIKRGKYSYFINKLYNSLLKSEQIEVNKHLEKFLLSTKDFNGELISFFNHFNPSIWKNLDELPRARIEEMIYASICKGNENSNDGYLATWACEWINEFAIKDKIIDELFIKLSIKNEAKYVINYFATIISSSVVISERKEKIENELEEGNKYYKELLRFAISNNCGIKLSKSLEKKYNDFSENEDYFDNLPFY